MKRDYLFKADERGYVDAGEAPWGTLVAIDLHTGLKQWEVPLGYMLDPAKYPGAEKWGSLNFGGAIVNGGNLIFVAASLDGISGPLTGGRGRCAGNMPYRGGDRRRQ